jgi:hypothetical protein
MDKSIQLYIKKIIAAFLLPVSLAQAHRQNREISRGKNLLPCMASSQFFDKKLFVRKNNRNNSLIIYLKIFFALNLY